MASAKGKNAGSYKLVKVEKPKKVKKAKKPKKTRQGNGTHSKFNFISILMIQVLICYQLSKIIFFF